MVRGPDGLDCGDWLPGMAAEVVGEYPPLFRLGAGVLAEAALTGQGLVGGLLPAGRTFSPLAALIVSDHVQM